MTTIHDVAAYAGVSIATVSNVLNRKGNTAEKTTAKVLAAVRELNYIPNALAKDLKANRSRTIGIIAEDVSAFMSGNIIDGISAVCETHDYAVTLCNLRAEHYMNTQPGMTYEMLPSYLPFQKAVSTAIDSLLSARVGGLIYIGLYPRDVSGILPDLGIPVVYTYCFTQNSGDYCVNYDDCHGSSIAMEHLISLGHTRIALISGVINSIPGHKRMKGYTESLMKHNLLFDPTYIITGDWGFPHGYRSCMQLLDLPEPPTAIFCMSDVLAFGALTAAHERGIRIPEQLSVHGFDDLLTSQFYLPPLTTVSLPLAGLGKTSADLLLCIISGNTPEARGILVPCTEIVRSSTRAPVSVPPAISGNT